MWTITGVEPSTGRVRQHGDLSYWMSSSEIMSLLGVDVSSGGGPWAVTQPLESLLNARRRTALQANFDPDIGVLEFLVERRDEWDSFGTATWINDEAEVPGNPKAAARAGGREIVWHLEGFDPRRLFMVEDFELSHRIPDADILAGIADLPDHYYGGLPPSRGLVDLIEARIGLQICLKEIDYQVNACSRYG
jgi:hypothetical protein